MYRYKVILKNGTEIECESKYLSLSTIAQQMNESNAFVLIGETAVNRYEVMSVKLIDTDEDETQQSPYPLKAGRRF